MRALKATEEGRFDNEIIPIEQHDVKLMSMGFLLDDKSPAIVRGPLAALDRAGLVVDAQETSAT